MIYTGLVIGFIFGFLLKRSRFCATGTIRDVYLEKRTYNIILVLAIIFTESFIYHSLIYFELIPKYYFSAFPYVSIAIGGFIFGFGAVMSNGCLTSTLVKCGDGRIIGFVSLITFIITSYIAVEGPLKPITSKLSRGKILQDELFDKVDPLIMIGVSLAVMIVLYITMYRHYKSHKLKFKLPSKYTGIRHILFEKRWPLELTVVVMGVLMGVAFLLSGPTGREGGFGISTPILTWADQVCPIDTSNIGWAIDGRGLGWGSMFVLGILLGSFVTTLLSKEYSVVKPNKSTIVKVIIGSILMALGSVWGQGCLMANGLVASAQFSVKAWFGFAFIVMGIFASARIFLKRDL